jgi:uncharacterized protein
MILPDVNLLVYAHDQEARFHTEAKAWWQSALQGSETVGIPWIVLLAFIRLTTHANLMKQPLGVRQVRGVIEFWLSYPQVRILFPSMASLPTTWDLLEAAGSGGNLCTDASIAALALEHGGCVYSNDQDFSRFPKLKWKNPL